MSSIANLKIKLFADGAERAQIVKFQSNPLIRGFTTNPTLMRAAGVKVDSKTSADFNGKFGWAMDPEGNRIELWEPK